MNITIKKSRDTDKRKTIWLPMEEDKLEEVCNELGIEMTTEPNCYIEDARDEISYVYSGLVDDKWTLDEVLNSKSNFLKGRQARVDIWFEEPYNFICEFDEKQHFNQYRLVTLERGYKNLKPSFDYNSYYNLSSEIVVKPGKSGFHKLKGLDILFPEMLKAEKQDNRIRQRAFRDYLKDIVPVKLGYNPTVRISYQVTNNKIKEFTEEGLENAKKYLYEIDIFKRIELKL